MENFYKVDKLINLLGLNRHDEQIDMFLKQVCATPEITIDKEDGADDEYIEFKELGFGLHFMSDILSAIHFHSEYDISDYKMYYHPLPMGIHFKQSKSEILAFLGEPDDKGGGGYDEFFGYIPNWIKYKMDDYTLHIEFTSDCKRIQVVTIMNYE